MTYLTGVVVPVYANTSERLQYLGPCLDSLARQDEPFIGLVVDDGSKEFESVRRIVSELDSENIRLVQRERQNDDVSTSSNAINYGLNLLLDNDQSVLSSDETISSFCYLHSDDMLGINSLSSRAHALNADPNVGFTYGRQVTMGSEGEIQGFSPFRSDKISESAAYPHHSTMWKRDFLEKLRDYNMSRESKYAHEGVFDPRLGYAEDFDVTASTIELAEKVGLGSKQVGDFTYYYRVQPESITATISDKSLLKTTQFVDAKHGLKDVAETPVTGRLRYVVSNLPWSLFSLVPDSVKELARPYKHARMAKNDRYVRACLSDPLLGKK